MEITRSTARGISRAAWVMAAFGTVVGQIHALARAQAQVRSARAYLFDEVGRVWDDVVAGTRVTVAQRADVRLACTNAAAMSIGAVDRAFSVAGGSAVYLDSPLQRCLRDLHVAGQHAMLSPRLLETWSRLRLGLDADTTLL